MEVETVADLLARFVRVADAGIGIDVEAADRFMTSDQRIFTADELAYCAKQSNPPESRAGRWCAKEAVSKACSKFLQLTLREIEICTDHSGRPFVVLPVRAAKLGLNAEVSISHACGVAVAVAVAVTTSSVS